MQLILNTFGSILLKKDDMFYVQINDKKVKISPKKVSSILVGNSIRLSSDAIALALENNIDITFLDKYGNPYGKVWFPRIGSTTLIRRKLLQIDLEDKGLPIIKEWMVKKAKNQISLIQNSYNYKKKVNLLIKSNLQKMNELCEKIKVINEPLEKSANTIMGYEGNISRLYFQALNLLIPEKYQFQGRSSHPAKDPFNAMLNYTYGVLYSKVEKALLIAGLDPYIGLLHKDNYNKKSLVFDFIEPYRTYCDQTVYNLCNDKKVDIEDFETSGKGVVIGDNMKKVIISELNKYFDEVIDDGNKNRKRVDTILADAHRFANLLIKE